MDDFRTTIWYEDLECHRQPSLYYLSGEDHPDGPHLICDWNGPPTDFEEFNIDLMNNVIQNKLINMVSEGSCSDNDTIPENIVPKSNSSQTILTEEDGSRLDFLTVPPIVNSLLKRLVKEQNKKNRNSASIPEEPEKSTVPTPTQEKSQPSHTKQQQHSTTKRGKPKKEAPSKQKQLNQIEKNN